MCIFGATQSSGLHVVFRRTWTDLNPNDRFMNTTEALEEIEIESRIVKAARLTFLGSLLFWPLFLFALTFMLGAPGKTETAMVERRLLDGCVWLYPLAVALGWMLCKRGLRRGSSDLVCLLPWLIPAVVFAYWLVYFTL